MRKKSKIKRGILLLGIIFSISIFSNCNFSNERGPNNSTSVEIQNEINLKTANSEITIITPENKTYTESMSGYYPATYGFENDDDGAVANDWSGQAIVESSYDGHNKVIKHTTYGWDAIRVNYDNQTSGTIEFYFNTDNVNRDLQFNCFGYDPGGGGKRPIILGVHNGNFRRNDGSFWYLLDIGTPCSVNTWYHVRIDFDCNTDTWNTSINGVLKSWDDPFAEGDSKYINDLRFYQFLSPVITRFDAIGFSWDPYYNIGNNRQEGLLLSFENTTTLECMSYSLDGQTNITILGNTTIPFPVVGSHTIQIFGNDSLGNIYQSNVRYFTRYWDLTGSPIFIDGDATGFGAHNWTWVEQQFWFGGGNGSKINPFIIEYLIINGQGSGNCIYIRDSSKYFIIGNCMIYNASTGIKIVNCTNCKLIGNIINDIKGIDGMDGGAGQVGFDGTDAIGIFITNCSEILILSNKISSVSGGNGGEGGGLSGTPPKANAGGNGGHSYGLYINDSKKCIIDDNNISSVIGGEAGDGGEDNYILGGCNGGEGGAGGYAIAIIIKYSKDIYSNQNNINNIFGGNGGEGGEGEIGLDGTEWEPPMGGLGGPGGNGGTGGYGAESIGINYIDSINISNYYNSIQNVNGGNGGKGGNAGNGGNAVVFAGMSWPGGDGGRGGNGGDGGFSAGISIENSMIIMSSIINYQNVIKNLNGGNGGLSGNAGNGGAGSQSSGAYPAGNGGNGKKGGDGGNGGICSGIMVEKVINVTNELNILENISGGNGTNGKNGGHGGNKGSGPGGSGGNGGNGGKGGMGGLTSGSHFKNTKIILNINNNIKSILGTLGGFGGSGGNGGAPNGIPGIYGTDGINNYAYGFNLENSNNSLSNLNSIYCQNNTDNGYNNQWDDGTIGNYWSHYFGEDINPIDGIGDDPFPLNGTANSHDNYPVIYKFYEDYDGDGLTNIEEYILGDDRYLTNVTNSDSDNEGLSDYWEWLNGTNPWNPDTDGDGYSDKEEIDNGWDPLDPNDPLKKTPDTGEVGDGDSDDDDDDKEEIEFLGPTLIIVGSVSGIGVAGIAIYFFRKKRLNLKR